MQKQRIFFLDNLRTATIFLVLVFHAALAYMLYAPDWWYVIDTKRVLSADILVIWADVFIMPVMFFISGYFGVKSLAAKSFGRFWASKWKRIGLPWIFGSVVLAPQLTYIIFQSRGIPIRFWDFYTTQFWGEAYQQGQFWYLGALLCLYTLLTLASFLMPQIRQQNVVARRPSPALLIAVVLGGAFAAAWIAALAPYGDNTWIHPLYLIVLQPTRVPFYLLYFALGVIAYRDRWFSAYGYAPSPRVWGLLFLLTSVAYVAYKLYGAALLQLAAQPYLFLNFLLHSLFCLCAVFGCLALFKACLDKTTPFWAELSAISYPVYVLHENIVMEFNWLFRPLEANAFIKYFLVCLCSLAVCCFAGKYILLKIPPFRQEKLQKKVMKM